MKNAEKDRYKEKLKSDLRSMLSSITYEVKFDKSEVNKFAGKYRKSTRAQQILC